MFGVSEGLIILAIVVLLFGGKKLPELAKALGQSLSNFKKGLKDSEPTLDDKSDKKIANSEDSNDKKNS